MLHLAISKQVKTGWYTRVRVKPGLMHTVWIGTRYNARVYERLSGSVGTGSSSNRVEAGGGVWALVRMMVVDYTQPQMMCCLAHITMNASLSHYLYIMATTPRRGQASSRLINPLTARPKEKWEARRRCSPLIHRLHLTPQPWIACRTHYMAFVISLYRRRYSQPEIFIMVLCTYKFSVILIGITEVDYVVLPSLLIMFLITVSRRSCRRSIQIFHSSKSSNSTKWKTLLKVTWCTLIEVIMYCYQILSISIKSKRAHFATNGCCQWNIIKYFVIIIPDKWCR